jgi:hypothetical protein
MQVSEARDRSPLVVQRLLIGVAALVLAGAAGAAPPSPLIPAQKRALAGISASAARGQLDPDTAGKDRTLVNRAAALIRTLPPARGALIRAQLDQVAALAARFSTPRALALFGQLQANELWFAKHAAPAPSDTDITDAQRVVYRFFPHRGFEFHPLANASALDNAAAAHDAATTQALAQALIARGIRQSGGGIGWEYEFDYGKGHAPWLSGMAQAVFAQAFARASTLLGDPTLMTEARAAFQAIPGRLVRTLPTGPWIRLYAFSNDVVLNAQLQAIVSLSEYAGASDDATASSLAAALEQSALAELPRFDAGYWSYYALPHTLSPLGYQQYVVTLLQKLAPRNAAFASAAARFNAYHAQPPAFKLADAGPGALKFWLSKPATVVVSAVGPEKRLSLGNGWHVLTWKLPPRAGIYPVQLHATDWAGNSASIEGLPLVRVAPIVATRRYTSRVASPATLGQPSFAVGVQLDDPSQATLAARERFGTLQVGVQWVAESAPDPNLVATLYALAARGRLVVELQPAQLPADDAGRSTLAAFITSLVQQVNGIRDILLGPPPTATNAAAYLAALGAVDDAVKATAAGAFVGGELDGNATPQSVLNALARAYRSSGRTTPPLDELALRPAAAPASGVWSIGDYTKAAAAIEKVFGAVPLLYDGVTAPAGLADPDQAAAYTQLLQSASCQPQVGGVVFGKLVDTDTDTSGFFAAGGTVKASGVTLKPLIAAAQRGNLAVCPGLGEPAATTALAFPADLSSGAVQLGCVRDCLYLLTLERASDGKPVLATRGILTGGATPATIALPGAPVAPGSYILSLRLVTATNPGPVQLVQSPPIAVG